MRTATLVCILALWHVNLTADIEITATPRLLETLVSTNLFKQGGRLYIQGSPDSPCYLFLESPRVRIEPPRIILGAHLTGRVGVVVADGCVGAGESFNITLSALPFAQGSRVGLRNIELASARYQPLIWAALRIGDQRSFDTDLGDAVARLLRSVELQPYDLTVTSLAVGRLTVQSGALRLGFDGRIGSQH